MIARWAASNRLAKYWALTGRTNNIEEEPFAGRLRCQARNENVIGKAPLHVHILTVRAMFAFIYLKIKIFFSFASEAVTAGSERIKTVQNP